MRNNIKSDRGPMGRWSANLVGDTKVEGRNLAFRPMCAGAKGFLRTNSPLVSFAESEAHHAATEAGGGYPG